jgi:uncharacterized membrane protein HdeD (DUF308 family)
MTTRMQRKSWYIWPFILILKLLWNLVTLVVSAVGRTAAIVLGVVLILVGMLLSLTIIGAIVGIPMMLIGVVLLIRAFTTRRRWQRRRL